MGNSKPFPNDTKKVFWKCGACSHSLFFILNREFGYHKEIEELSSDMLAGGIFRQGHQCGMLWGSSLAAGAESYKKCGNCNKAIPMSVTATQHILESFYKRSNTHDCLEITGCDMTTFLGMAKLILKTISRGFIYSKCFNLAEKWAPEAIQAAKEGLSQKQSDLYDSPVSCASEVAKRMGASEEQTAMVAGFAGGLGLSGNGCGALAAAIWMNTIKWCRMNPGKRPPYTNNKDLEELLKVFYAETDSRIRCSEICGKNFTTLEEHSVFIKSGGCDKLIDLLTRPVSH